MQGIASIGTPPWTRAQMVDALEEFACINERRPVRDNPFGMRSPHLFATWFMARHLDPDLIVESGVYRGLGTWILEQACPKARLICIDPDLAQRQYISPRAEYSTLDFSLQDWSGATERSLAFFDDHQDALGRLRQCRWLGLRHVIFEDNYPPARGDCYSLKQAFACAGFTPSRRLRGIGGVLSRSLDRLVRASTPASIPPGDTDERVLRRQLDAYFEFPPVFRVERTRWGDVWTDEAYPTPDPLLAAVTKPAHQAFLDEATSYNWICYARLR